MSYPTLARRGVAGLLDDMFGVRPAFDRLIDRYGSHELITAWAPAVDVREDGNVLEVEVELPGLRSGDVDVLVENGILTIRGEKKTEVEEGTEGSSYHLVERRYGRFERTFTLPRSVDAERVDARFSNGLLRVTLPKSETAKPRRIVIKAEHGGDGK